MKPSSELATLTRFRSRWDLYTVCPSLPKSIMAPSKRTVIPMDRTLPGSANLMAPSCYTTSCGMQDVSFTPARPSHKLSCILRPPVTFMAALSTRTTETSLLVVAVVASLP